MTTEEKRISRKYTSIKRIGPHFIVRFKVGNQGFTITYGPREHCRFTRLMFVKAINSLIKENKTTNKGVKDVYHKDVYHKSKV